MTVVRARPRRLRVVCWIAAVALVAGFAAIASGMHGRTEGGGVFRRGDAWAMVGVGVLLAAGVLALSRPRVEADERGVRVRNVLGSYDLPWSLVVAVRFDRGAPWASLELAQDEAIPVMAVQAADGPYAVAAVTGLRRLHADQRGPTAPPGPTLPPIA